MLGAMQRERGFRGHMMQSEAFRIRIMVANMCQAWAMCQACSIFTISFDLHSYYQIKVPLSSHLIDEETVNEGTDMS